MFTINYKGYLIHGYFDKTVCTINSGLTTFKSMHSAKCYITRVMIPAHNAAMCEFVKRISE